MLDLTDPAQLLQFQHRVLGLTPCWCQRVYTKGKEMRVTVKCSRCIALDAYLHLSKGAVAPSVNALVERVSRAADRVAQLERELRREVHPPA